MKLAKMKVSSRLLLGFACVLSLLVAVAAISVIRMQQASEVTDYLLKEKIHNERLINEWKHIIEVNVPKSIAAGKTTDPVLQKFFKDSIKKSSARATELQGELEKHLKDPQAKALFAAALEQRVGYQKARAIAYKAKEAGDQQATNKFFDEQFIPSAEKYVAVVSQLEVRQRELIGAMADDLQQRSIASRNLVIALSLAAILLGLTLALLISRSLLRQLGANRTTRLKSPPRLRRATLQ